MDLFEIESILTLKMLKSSIRQKILDQINLLEEDIQTFHIGLIDIFKDYLKQPENDKGHRGSRIFEVGLNNNEVNDLIFTIVFYECSFTCLLSVRYEGTSRDYNTDISQIIYDYQDLFDE